MAPVVELERPALLKPVGMMYHINMAPLNQRPPNLFAWASAWRAPAIPALWTYHKKPDGTMREPLIHKNTRNHLYNQKLPTRLMRWKLDQNIILNHPVIRNLWHIPIVASSNAIPAYYQPITGRLKDGSRATKFSHEAALTSRLDEHVFSDLQRVLNQIAYWRPPAETLHEADFPYMRPNGWVPVFSMPGSYARPPIVSNDEIRQEEWTLLPDRCALIDDSSEPPFDETIRLADQRSIRTRCVGEIKPSYKFDEEWLETLVVEPGVNPLNAFNAAGLDSFEEEALQVLAQTTYYMRRLGICPWDRTKAVTYGYIITDKDVVLLRRREDFAQIADARPLDISQSFPLRPTAEEIAQNKISGMLALVFIHLLAGTESAYSGVAPE
ncbi:hypothetical protein C8Q79DRAFT_130387 [Trametes meyenii]|nr:hypothetical protein C8Q79DRAFT_130387 [Trametes meyenii]